MTFTVKDARSRRLSGAVSPEAGTETGNLALQALVSRSPVSRPPVSRPPLEYTPGLAREMAPWYEKVRHVVPALEWPVFAPYIKAIQDIKRERGALLLAHNYMTPEIFHCVGDFMGDSLALARKAAQADADIIVQCGVRFMAETSKILSPQKTVLIPDAEAGCSLASGITAADVHRLRQQHPGVPVVSYVNTTAEVKAQSDICCTSSNAVQVVNSLGVREVIFIPDQYLAMNVAAQTDVRIHTFAGSCEVHERFSPQEIRDYRETDPDLVVLAHPECPPGVVAEADFSGSTAAMIDWVKTNIPKKVLMVTECSMSDNVAAEMPEVEFIRPCNLCPHMKRITLPKILDSLLHLREEVTVAPELIAPARQAVERMLALPS